jgi:hypothetical protein
MAMNGVQDSEISMVRVELGYCPRCGTLRAYPAGAAAEDCKACVRFLAWIRSGCERPPRRRPRHAEAPTRPELTRGKGSRT